jgi:3,4-dihydroxy-2-butanone 4-phosphate synthase
MRCPPWRAPGPTGRTSHVSCKSRTTPNGVYGYGGSQNRYTANRLHPFNLVLKSSLGTTTGISAHDRALTVRALASPSSLPSDFTRPGHMVPLRARDGGTLTRKGHTEASVDLCLLTNLPKAGVLCELVNDDEEGSMARRDDCRRFADHWGLKMISVEMLAEWRMVHGDSVVR